MSTAVGKRCEIFSLSRIWTTGITTARSDNQSGSDCMAVRKSAVGSGSALSKCSRHFWTDSRFSAQSSSSVLIVLAYSANTRSGRGPLSIELTMLRFRLNNKRTAEGTVRRPAFERAKCKGVRWRLSLVSIASGYASVKTYNTSSEAPKAQA